MLSVLVSAGLLLGALLVAIRFRTVLAFAGATGLVLGAFAVLNQPSLDELGQARMHWVYGIGEAPGAQEGGASPSKAELILKTGATVSGRAQRALSKGAEVDAHDSLVEIRGAGTAEEVEALKAVLAARGLLEFVAVADDEDVLGELAKSHDVPLAGLRFEVENAPLGVGRQAPRYYAFLPVGEGETMDKCLERLRGWAETFPLPKDKKFAFEQVSRFDSGTETWENEGWRTFILERTPLLTMEDIREAQATPDQSTHDLTGWLVRLEFTAAGATIFADATERLTKRRFAIVVDGIVERAPVVQGRIAGGHGVITMGAGAPEQQRKDAMRLAAVLRSGALPAPLTLQIEERIQPVLEPAFVTGLYVLTALALLVEIALAWRMALQGSGRAAGAREAT